MKPRFSRTIADCIVTPVPFPAELVLGKYRVEIEGQNANFYVEIKEKSENEYWIMITDMSGRTDSFSFTYDGNLAFSPYFEIEIKKDTIKFIKDNQSWECIKWVN
ncbi:MAG: hypothetical protein LBH04_06395 [Tannerellaceae bacterium]|nr:hypothetical protein [Tannerellaceae bacterium]